MSDHLGFTSQLLDGNGTRKARYDYQSYGKLEGNSSNPLASNPFTYTAREDDATGLLYYRARYYDPELEMFISQDPLGDAQRYVSGNPLSYTDPSGKGPVSGFLAGGGDFITFGWTKAAREKTGGYNNFNIQINPCSGAYKAGAIATFVVFFFVGIGEFEGAIHAGRGIKALRALETTEATGVASYSQATKLAFERQLAVNGEQALLKARSSLQARLNEHIQKIATAKANGGYTSSMEREVRSFKNQINAINDVLKGH